MWVSGTPKVANGSRMRSKVERSMSKKNTQAFFDLYCVGDALATDIDDFIDEWHDGDSDISLHEYLGMTHEEYKYWLENPSQLHWILICRRNGLALSRAVAPRESIAARNCDQRDLELLKAYAQKKIKSDASKKGS